MIRFLKGGFKKVFSPAASVRKGSLKKGLVLLAALASIVLSPSASLAKHEERVLMGASYYYFTAAQMLRKSGNITGAVELYKKVIEADPSSPVLHTGIAELYIELENFAEAKTHLKKAMELSPGYAPAYEAMAEVELGLNSLEGAIKNYRKAIELSPEESRNYYYLATLFAKEKEYGKAEEVLTELLGRQPDSLMAHYYLAKIEYEKGDYRKSEEHYLKAIEINEYFEAAYYELGLTYELDNKRDKAAEIYGRGLSVIKDGKDLRSRLGAILIQEGKLDEALAQYMELEKYPDARIDALTKTGLILFEKKDYAGAIERFTEVLEERPELSRVRYYLAVSYEELGDMERASGEFLKIREGDESFIDSKIHLAYIYQRLGDVDKTVAQLKEAMKVKKDVELVRLLASILRDEKRVDEAIEVVSASIGETPDAELYYILGVLYDDKGLEEESFKALYKAIELDPEHVNALNHIGYSYAEKGIRLDEAETFIKRALQVKPDSGHILDSLGWVYYQKGEFKKAVIELEKALKYLPEDPVVLEHLGDAYLKSSSREKALSAYENASALDPANALIKDKIEKLKEELKLR